MSHDDIIGRMYEDYFLYGDAAARHAIQDYALEHGIDDPTADDVYHVLNGEDLHAIAASQEEASAIVAELEREFPFLVVRRQPNRGTCPSCDHRWDGEECHLCGYGIG